MEITYRSMGWGMDDQNAIHSHIYYIAIKIENLTLVREMNIAGNNHSAIETFYNVLNFSIFLIPGFCLIFLNYFNPSLPFLIKMMNNFFDPKKFNEFLKRVILCFLMKICKCWLFLWPVGETLVPNTLLMIMAVQHYLDMKKINIYLNLVLTFDITILT